MDGVAGITQKGIPPGGVYHYQFTLHQAGTYWYHAHEKLQEQQGMYGAFIIEPSQPSTYHYTKDFAVVLSDWSNTDPEQIEANLKKSGDYYSPRFPLQPSLQKFLHDYQSATPAEKKVLLDDYKMMQQMRMSIYDFSDVAYDAFLLNGRNSHAPWQVQVKLGDVVRLRFIGAAGASIFRVKIPGTTMKVVHVQGNDVKPYNVNDFMIAPGETLDVLVNIDKKAPYIIYAESIDTLGAAYGGLTTTYNPCLNLQKIKAFPEPLPVSRTMMQTMMGSPEHSMQSHMNMNMNMNMDMPTESTIIGDRIYPPNTPYHTTPATPYQDLRASVKTNNTRKPVAQIIKMELFGYMERYIWFINGVPEYNAKPIVIEAGKRYRLIFTNTSMMHHPMHIHGHWFILRKGLGAYDPLLHTIDVPPGATITADIDADASGQWLFHCHLLYHMMSGMARVFQYSSIIDITECRARPENTEKNTAYINRSVVRVDASKPIDKTLIMHPMAHPMHLYSATTLDIGEDPVNKVKKANFKNLYGSDYNKLELFIDDAEIKDGRIVNADCDIFYWHLLDQFWAIKGGVNYFYRPAKTPYWQPGLGIEGLMPYFIDTNIRSYFYHNSFKLDVELSRDTQLTRNFFLRTAIRSILATKTVDSAEIGSGLNQMRYIIRPYYRLMHGLNLFLEYENEQDYGAFKSLQAAENDQATQNTFTFGIAVLF